MIVIVWVEFQLAVVKVNEGDETVPSDVSPDDIPIVTLAVGCELSLTVKIAVPPPSVVVSPLVGLTIIPTASSSILVTVTSCASSPT